MTSKNEGWVNRGHHDMLVPVGCRDESQGVGVDSRYHLRLVGAGVAEHVVLADQRLAVVVHVDRAVGSDHQDGLVRGVHDEEDGGGDGGKGLEDDGLWTKGGG